MNTNIKPFYIYTDRNSLYIKNINENSERLASNIYIYSANIDKNNNIHILAIDNFGKLIHFFNNNGIWKKKIIRKYFNTTKNIQDMRVYILNDYFNVFIVERYPLDDNQFKISHINYNISNYSVFRHKLNIDELSNIVFQYKTIDILSRDTSYNTIIFNSISRKWITSIPLIRNNKIYLNEKNISSNIKSDILEYCYSIKYKL